MPGKVHDLDSVDAVSLKERVISVATKLFAEKGFAGVSIRDIAAIAKVSVSTVHYHGESKRRLLEQCLESAFASETQMVELIASLESVKVHDQASFFAAYDEFVEAILSHGSANPMVGRLWWRLLLDHPDIFRTLENKHIRGLFLSLMKFLKSARDEGWIRGDDRSLALFLASIDWIYDGFFVGGLINPAGRRSSPGDKQQIGLLRDWLKQYGRRLLT